MELYTSITIYIYTLVYYDRKYIVYTLSLVYCVHTSLYRCVARAGGPLALATETATEPATERAGGPLALATEPATALATEPAIEPAGGPLALAGGERAGHAIHKNTLYSSLHLHTICKY